MHSALPERGLEFDCRDRSDLVLLNTLSAYCRSRGLFGADYWNDQYPDGITFSSAGGLAE
jgi:hypothetical protein